MSSPFSFRNLKHGRKIQFHAIHFSSNFVGTGLPPPPRLLKPSRLSGLTPASQIEVTVPFATYAPETCNDFPCHGQGSKQPAFPRPSPGVDSLCTIKSEHRSFPAGTDQYPDFSGGQYQMLQRKIVQFDTVGSNFSQTPAGGLSSSYGEA